MELVNHTRMIAGLTTALDVEARESAIIVVKGTFRFPEQEGGRLTLGEQQVPLVMSDVFFGEPGRSSPQYESDFAPRKAYCDVLLNATAHAPGGRPARRVDVGVRVGAWSKTFAVVGDRAWEGGGRTVGVSATVPFTELPIRYDRAFGGCDENAEDPSQHSAYLANPAGVGYHKDLRRGFVDGTRLPNTEEHGQSVTRPDATYRPMSFGSIGRQWWPRVTYTGTYDQAWLDDVFPFLPADFDYRYFQAAPPDQQVPKPRTDHPIRLLNLTREGQTDFILPHLDVPIYVFSKDGYREHLSAQVDTILIEPDSARVLVLWRVARPLKRDVFEVAQVLVGRKGRDWWQQPGETVFPLSLIVERRQRAL